jgi:hypothetical protein
MNTNEQFRNKIPYFKSQKNSNIINKKWFELSLIIVALILFTFIHLNYLTPLLLGQEIKLFDFNNPFVRITYSLVTLIAIISSWLLPFYFVYEFIKGSK